MSAGRHSWQGGGSVVETGAVVPGGRGAGGWLRRRRSGVGCRGPRPAAGHRREVGITDVIGGAAAGAGADRGAHGCSRGTGGCGAGLTADRGGAPAAGAGHRVCRRHRAGAAAGFRGAVAVAATGAEITAGGAALATGAVAAGDTVGALAPGVVPAVRFLAAAGCPLGNGSAAGPARPIEVVLGLVAGGDAAPQGFGLVEPVRLVVPAAAAAEATTGPEGGRGLLVVEIGGAAGLLGGDPPAGGRSRRRRRPWCRPAGTGRTGGSDTGATPGRRGCRRRAGRWRRRTRRSPGPGPA